MTIRKVKEFKVGGTVVFEDRECVIKKFPTRTSVVIVPKSTVSGQWSSAKILVRELREKRA